MEEGVAKSAYRQWVEREGVPLVDTPAGTDLLAMTEFRPWDRMGVRAVFLNQPETMRGQVGAFLLEIPPKASSKPLHHMYDEILYILRGHGRTDVWITEDKKVSVEWHSHDLVAIPLNAWFQITNLEEQPAKILSFNTAPSTINFFNAIDFIFHNEYLFRDRFCSQDNYYKTFKEWYSEEGQEAGWVYEANFTLDLYSRSIPEASTPRGRGPAVAILNLVTTHSPFARAMVQLPEGTYARAHKHVMPGWFGIVVRGNGYSLKWKENTHHWSKASEKVRYEEHEGVVFSHPDPWYHQHFNTGDGPFRNMAAVYGAGPKRPVWKGTALDNRSISEGGDRVMYEEEDPEVLRLFIEELKKVGREPRPMHEWRRD